MSRYLEKAKEIRAIENPHHNCTQSVLMSFTQNLNMNNETAFRLGANFGGGMKCGLTCGALAGALMTLGLYGVDDPATTQKVVKEFTERHNKMINCSDLLKANAAAGGQKKTHCDALVYEMVQVVEEILLERNLIK